MSLARTSSTVPLPLAGPLRRSSYGVLSIFLWLQLSAAVEAQDSSSGDAGVSPSNALDAPPDAALPDAGALEPTLALPVTAPESDPQPSAATSSSTPAPPSPPGAAFSAHARKGRLAPGEIAHAGTASRVNAPLEELPASVTVLDDKTIRERGALSIDQALNLVSGLTPVWQYGGFLYMTMRGFQAVSLVDGFRDTRAMIAESAPQGGLLDLDRIEVLRGPSSVLYGYGAVGGVVNLIHRQPSRIAQYSLDLGLGLPNQQLIQGGAQGPLGKMFAYRVDLGRVASTNYRGASVERNQVTTALSFTPAREHTFGVRFAYSFDHYNTDVGIPTVEDPNKPGTWGLPRGARLEARYNTKNDFIDYQRLDLTANYRWDISRVTYLQARGNLVRDYYDYLAAETLTYVPGSATDMTPATVDREYLHFARAWTPVVGQLELHSEASTGPIKHQFALGYEISGLYGQSDRGDNGDAVPGSVGFAYPDDDATPTHRLQRTSRDYYRYLTNSLYGFDHIHVLDNLIVTGGLRVDTVTSRLQRQFVDRETGDRVPDPMTGTVRPAIHKSESAPTGQVGVVYNPTVPLTLYAGYSTAFKPNFVYPSDRSPNDFRPERSQQVEGGVRVRSVIQGHALDFDGAAYYIEKRNVVQPRGPVDFDQAGKVESRGLDLALHYTAPAVIGVDLSYALTHADFVEFFSPDPVTGENRDLKGKRPVFTPRHMGQLWVRLALTHQVGFGVGGRWLADQYADQENRLPLPNYALLDMSAWFRGEHVSFVLSARNVLDKRNYFTSAINSWAVNPQVTPGPNREIMATLRLTL